MHKFKCVLNLFPCQPILHEIDYIEGLLIFNKSQHFKLDNDNLGQFHEFQKLMV